MTLSARHLARPVRHLGRLALGLVFAATLVPASAAPAAAADALTLPQAEVQLVRLLNERRLAAGLVPYRVDSRLTEIARERSADMASKGYFSHVQPDGRTAFDYIAERKITWYGAGEVLAKNNYPTLADSAAVANTGWTNSPGHNAVVMSTGYNYVGVGLAVDSAGKKLWTAVMLKGPDRSGARSAMKSVAPTGTSTSTSVNVSVVWSGWDVRLQVLTAGLADFQLQRRVDGGSWQTVATGTAATSVVQALARGRLWEFRIRARDKAANYGAWSAPVGTRT